MEKPYAKIETVIRSEDRIRESLKNLELDLQKAFRERVGLIETKLKRVTEENNELHHERLLLAKEIQKLRTEKQAVLEVLGIKKD